MTENDSRINGGLPVRAPRGIEELAGSASSRRRWRRSTLIVGKPNVQDLWSEPFHVRPDCPRERLSLGWSLLRQPRLTFSIVRASSVSMCLPRWLLMGHNSVAAAKFGIASAQAVRAAEHPGLEAFARVVSRGT